MDKQQCFLNISSEFILTKRLSVLKKPAIVNILNLGMYANVYLINTWKEIKMGEGIVWAREEVLMINYESEKKTLEDPLEILSGRVSQKILIVKKS